MWRSRRYSRFFSLMAGTRSLDLPDSPRAAVFRLLDEPQVKECYQLILRPPLGGEECGHGGFQPLDPCERGADRVSLEVV